MTFEEYWAKTEISKVQPTILAQSFEEIAKKAWEAGYEEGYSDGFDEGYQNGYDTAANDNI